MELSCLPVSLYADIIEGRMSLAEWAQLGVELGLDAIDVSILFFEDRSAEALAEARRQVEERGISLCMMSTYPDFCHPDPKQRARQMDLARETVDAAHALGVRYVRAIAGQAHPETGLDEGIAWAAQGLADLTSYARQAGVTVVYENHDQAGVMQYQDFSARQEIFLAICEATAASGLGINYDTANATVLTPDPLYLLEQVLDRVTILHASDAYWAAEGHRWCVIGRGVVPFDAIFGRLHAAAWDGWISIEEASGTGRSGIEQAVRYVRKTWQESGAQ